MASDQGEESRAENASNSRQKRRRSFTGMLRDSLSLLVPSFVMDVSTPKRRRVQDEPNAATNDRINSSSTYSYDVFPGPSLSTTKQSNVNPLNLPTTSHGESSTSRFRLESPFTAPPAVSEFRTINQPISSSDTVHDRIGSKMKKNPFSFPAAHQPLPSSSRSDLLNTSSARRPHLNDSIAPSSSLLWTQHSDSSSSSVLGETYHQSPFYPGKITFGGAAGCRREVSRNLHAAKRYQSTVVPMRLTSVIANRASPGADDISESGSSSAESGPILSAATRRILKAMRRGSSSVTAESGTSHRESLGRTAHSVRHQRHMLWDSCVRRNTRSTPNPLAPPTSELRRLPQSTPFGPGKSAVVSSWPRDTIGVPVLSSSGARREPQSLSTRNVHQEAPNMSEKPKSSSALGSLSSFAFSTPASRSQPSTRPPSVASDAEIGQLQFTFPSPPSRSASSNALADMAASSALPQGNALFSVNSPNSAVLPPSISAQSAADHASLCSKKDLTSEAASSTILFSASRTLPEVRPPLNSYSVSYPTTQKSTTTKRALPQDSWRCESCLAENAFLTSACRTCQRSPSSVVVDAQRKWHVEVNAPPSSIRKVGEEFSKKKSKCEKCLKIIEGNVKLCDACVQCNKAVKDNELPAANNDTKWKCDSCNLLNDNRCLCCSGCKAQKTSSKPNSAISFLKKSNDGLPKWRCDVCLVENDENKETCICCQSPKPKSMKSALEVKSIQNNVGKWRCDTCLVENDSAKESCVCCQGPKPKIAAEIVSPIVNKEKWRCETCLVENDSDKTQCVCCQSPKPLSLASKVGGMEKWRCDTCLVENDSTKERCCACEAEKPKQQRSALSITSSGKWQCETCLVENEASLDKCVCCESVNPKKKSSQVPVTSNGPNKSIFESGGLLSSWKSSTSSQFKFGSSVSDTATGEDSKKKAENNPVQNDSNKPTFAFGGTSEIKFGSSNGGMVKFGSTCPEIKFGSSTSSTVKFGSVNGSESKVGAPNSSTIDFGTFNGARLQTSSETKGLIVPSNGPTISFGAPKSSENLKFGINNPEVKADDRKESSQIKPSKTDVCTSASESASKTVMSDSNISESRAVGSQSSNSLFGKKDGASGFCFKMDKTDTVGKSPFTSNPAVFMFGNKGSEEPSKPTNIPSTSAVLPHLEVGAKTLDSVVNRKNETLPVAASFGGRNLFGGNDSQQKADNAWPRPSFGEDKGAGGVKPSAITLNHLPVSQSSLSETKSGPPSTSIDSLFTNSSKVSMKNQDTKILSFGKPTDQDTNDSSLFSGFTSDTKQQKRMVSSVSSPSLNAFGAANNFGSGTTTPSFGQPSAPNSSGSGFNFNKASSVTNSVNEHAKEKTALPISFGKSNSDQPFVFNKMSEHNSAPIFGSTSQATSAPDPTPQSGASGIFGNNAGSTPFMFLGASSDSNTSTVQNAQSVPVISTNFQFGQQQSSNTSCFVFGNTNSTNSMPPTASSANPFNPTPNTNRPVKKAMRRIKKN